jgi:hypothetical protein
MCLALVAPSAFSWVQRCPELRLRAAGSGQRLARNARLSKKFGAGPTTYLPTTGPVPDEVQHEHVAATAIPDRHRSANLGSVQSDMGDGESGTEGRRCPWLGVCGSRQKQVL